MVSLRKVMVLASAEQHFALAANFVVAIVTSRLMAPDEIGIAVVGAAVVAIVTALREYASPSYLIKNGEMQRGQLGGVLTGMLATNVVLVVCLALAAPLIGNLYGDARLTHYLQLLALALLIEAGYTPVVAVLRREMAVDQAALIGITCASATAISTVALAMAGWGSASFGWGVLCGTTAGALAALFLRPRFWLIRPGFASWRSLFQFGGYNGTNSLLRQLYDSVPYLVLGQVLPFEVAAYFHRALMLSQLVSKLLLGGVEAMMLPHLMAQERQKRGLKEPLFGVLECVTALYWPALIILAALAHPIVRILYGEAWLPAVPLVQIMALAALFSFIGKIDTAVLVAAGAMTDLLRRSLIVYPICAAISTSAAFAGVAPLAWSYWLICPIQFWISIYFMRKHVFFTWSELGWTLSKSGIIAAASCIAPLAITSMLQGASMSPYQALFAGMGGLSLWLLAVWLTRHALLASRSAG